MSLTTDRNDPGLDKIKPSGQQESYLILSEEERAKGWVRPYRDAYVHIGMPLDGVIRDLTDEEKERYSKYNYVAFIDYPEDKLPLIGRYIDKRQEDNLLRNKRSDGCGHATTMARPLAETYARDPKFYGGTFCTHCGAHFPVVEFIWEGTNLKVGE